MPPLPPWLLNKINPQPTPDMAVVRASRLKMAERPFGDINADTKTDVNAETQYSQAVYRMLSGEKFDDLDQLADSLRQKKSKFSGGSWKLWTFYEGLLYFPGKSTDADWQARIELLTQWISQKPDSVTPRVALADAYFNYAWDARGNGFASKVGDDQWKVYNQRLSLAKQALDEAATLKTKCPEWYMVMMYIARSQGWSREQEDALLEKAMAFEPTYRGYYVEYANYLQPKWFGDEGDWENFANRISIRLGSKEGPIVYYRIANNMNCCDYDAGAIFTNANLSWEKVKAGCNAVEQVYGQSMPDLNDCAKLAGEAEDRPYAKKLFARIGDNWDPSTWTNKQSFDQAKAWALSGQ